LIATTGHIAGPDLLGSPMIRATRMAIPCARPEWHGRRQTWRGDKLGEATNLETGRLAEG